MVLELLQVVGAVWLLALACSRFPRVLQRNVRIQVIAGGRLSPIRDFFQASQVLLQVISLSYEWPPGSELGALRRLDLVHGVLIIVHPCHYFLAVDNIVDGGYVVLAVPLLYRSSPRLGGLLYLPRVGGWQMESAGSPVAYGRLLQLCILVQ